MKSAEFQAQSNNDNVLRAAATGRTFKESVDNQVRIFGTNRAIAEQYARQAQATIGLGAKQQVAAAQQLVATGTGYDNMGQMVSTLGLASGGNTATASRLAGFANATAKQVARHDLSPGFGTLNDLVQRQGVGGEQLTNADYANAMGDAWGSGDPVTLVRDKAPALKNHLDRHTNAYQQAMADHQAAVSAGDSAGQQDALRRAQQAEAAIYEMEQSKMYASGENAGIIDDAVQSVGAARAWLGGASPIGASAPVRVARRSAADPNVLEWVQQAPTYLAAAQASSRIAPQRDSNREDVT